MDEAGQSAEGTASRWRLGKFLVFSMLCHAALISLAWNFPQEEPAGDSPIVVELAAGPSAMPSSEENPPGAKASGARGKEQPAGNAGSPAGALDLPARRERLTPPAPLSGPLQKPSDTPPPVATNVSSPAAEAAASPVGDSGAEGVPAAGPLPADEASTGGMMAEPGAAAGGGFGALPGTGGPVAASFGVRNGPRVLRLMPPQYPLRARRLQKEGRVLLRLHLDPAGKVRTAEVVEAAGYGFDEAAVAAVKNSRFLPASRNGVPVACLALLPIRFELQPGP